MQLERFVRMSLLFPAAAFGLIACGGGDSESAPPPPPSSTLTVTGVAASGGAIAGQLGEAKCSGGNGSATTAADGSYTITLPAGGGSLPCVLRVTTAGGQALHSVASGSGSSATAHLTPVSELAMAYLAGGA